MRTGFAGSSEDSLDTNEFAIASVFLGVIWIFGFGSAFGIYAALRALKEIREAEEPEGGRTLAIAGLVICIVGVLSGPSSSSSESLRAAAEMQG